jgi:Type II secretion system (T2SS), protein M subtype b
MIERFSPGMRKFVALGLLAGLLALFGNLAVAPVVERWRALDEQTIAGRERAARLSALSASLPGARALEQGEAVLASAVYLPGESEAIQLANLQTHVGEILQRAAVRAQSTRTLSTVRREGVSMVGLQLVLQADVARTRDILHRLEVGAPRLMIDGLAITPANRSGGSAGIEDLLQLDIRLFAAVRATNNAGAR